ncbi:membrane protein insertion efficiency factor YidD [Agromyces bauzanensis]|uniref:Putative membrane protein insertion efficiency factor n=1 Tax=Agromyces bauzanensis TaxID=1308924 RepID=A0A917PI52_9MICO|nr:membrane protein insertion efficiency factor YidD [Agromyces bauzanensis]GGJ80001.1 putative membrane protein insertion efficiency factor [Agromyces bauzanensis]
MRNLLLFLLLFPRNLGVLLLRGYRAVISPLYGDVCRYYPSCSAYGLGSVQQSGLLVGSALTAWRILRCNPWTAGGIDDVRPARHGRYAVTPFGWVVPRGMFPKAEADAAAARLVHEHTHRAADHASAPAPATETTNSSPILSRKD